MGGGHNGKPKNNFIDLFSSLFTEKFYTINKYLGIS